MHVKEQNAYVIGMSTFVNHHTKKLFWTALSPPNDLNPPSPSFSHIPSSQTKELQTLLGAFGPSYSSRNVRDVLILLRGGENSRSGEAQSEYEKNVLRRAAIGAVVAWLYGQVLDLCLRQATEADAEADWWSEIERSRREILWYFFETLPLRLKRVFNNIVGTLRSRGLTVTPASFRPSNVRRLFPTSIQPSRLAVSFFPHLSTQVRMPFHSPFELTRQECRYHRNNLQKIRDDRAQRLGSLVFHRDRFQIALTSGTKELTSFINEIQKSIDDKIIFENPEDDQAVVERLLDIVLCKLPRASTSHNHEISTFLRPSWMMRMWPHVVILPPTTLIIFRMLYGARGSLRGHLNRAIDTVSGFWRGYLVQPLREVLDTVRTGGEEGVRIVSKEGVRSDMESLERMVLSLSREKYTLTASELENLSKQIRRGDLTSVLRIYEEDMRSPLKSAVAGSLVRSILIQVQKMKVDVDVALSGIDKLLKSQELTFAFVGVAPALAIVYTFFGWIKNTWSIGRGKGKYGSREMRRSVWVSIRRVERLLTFSTTGSPLGTAQKGGLSTLDQGLILLSVAQLRTYAESCLPTHSRLREEFLVDVADLEDPSLGKREKMDVVDRMWRSWSQILQWTSIGQA